MEWGQIDARVKTFGVPSDDQRSRDGGTQEAASEETERSTKINAKVARRLGARCFDAAEYLRDDAGIAAYLEAAAAEEDPRVLAAALGYVARARGMSELARETGFAREALYRSLSADGNPELATLTKGLRAFGLRLAVQSVSP